VNPIRIALANLRFPATPDESVTLAEQAIHQASVDGARIICFPECFVPGYRIGKSVRPLDPGFLERAWSLIAAAAAKGSISVVLGTERVVDGGLRICALVIDADGSMAGFQDKVQLDPSEEQTYAPGARRSLFQAGPLTFGIAICHEGFRYPETVRWAAQRGARVVFHPHFHEAEPGAYQPTSFADPANTFHEKTALCRAAENTCYFATVNCASPGSPTTSAIIRPDGTLLSYQPYGEEGLLIADVDISTATGLLASRCRTVSSPAEEDLVTIRAFRAPDEQGVINLWRAVSRSDAPHNDPATAIRKKLAVDRDLFLVAVVGGTVVGTVMGGYDGHRGWIYSVAVSSEHRRRGVGAALIRQVETALVERGCLKINLQVLPSNPEAVAFYETLGYGVEARVSMGKRLYD
jgi:predicted amidohydrolase/ribosomal protein S18 acetylase RimI-like enzyme